MAIAQSKTATASQEGAEGVTLGRDSTGALAIPAETTTSIRLNKWPGLCDGARSASRLIAGPPPGAAGLDPERLRGPQAAGGSPAGRAGAGILRSDRTPTGEAAIRIPPRLQAEGMGAPMGGVVRSSEALSRGDRGTVKAGAVLREDWVSGMPRASRIFTRDTAAMLGGQCNSLAGTLPPAEDLIGGAGHSRGHPRHHHPHHHRLKGPAEGDTGGHGGGEPE